MKKDVIISLIGSQSEGGQTEEIELVTAGRYYQKDGSYFITYDETAMTGMEGTTTTLRVDDNVVTMLRHGTSNSQLIFEKGRRHLCCYETPYGAFTIGVTSKMVDVSLDDHGGEISAQYHIEIDNSTSGVNGFHMEIREC